eukprot:TRINITY_DN6745_c0_g1_i4.p1 TRINITY_DN6745_c0_g1~~TRINITY_DN6745_c0_g1_i4.p1  ORF type:complete len:493 (-),score=88.17 TRINITY_DN6745_c0_g1_i4:38-1420(-)
MGSRRGGCAAVVSGRTVVVVGGSDGSSFLQTAEVFNLDTEQWSPLPSMGSRRRYCAAVVSGRTVVVVGGRDGSSDLQTAEVFNLDTEQWSPLPSMGSRRGGCAAVVSGRTVVVVGGCDGSSALQTAVAFNLDTEQWSPLPSMGSRRRYCAAVVSGRTVMVFGGSGGDAGASAEKLAIEGGEDDIGHDLGTDYTATGGVAGAAAGAAEAASAAPQAAAAAAASARITEYEHVALPLSPIRGCFDDSRNPLVSIDDAIARQPDDLRGELWAAKQFARDPGIRAKTARVIGLTMCMVVAIWMYTTESPLYHKLNAALRSRDRTTLTSFYFPYLRLLLTAIRKIRAMGDGSVQIVNRGVKRDLVKEYPDAYKRGESMIWWSITSTTSDLEVLSNPLFLGNQGDRTLCQIKTRNAVDISEFSAIPEAELVMCCATGIRFTAVLDLGNGLKMINCEDDDEIPSMLS